MVANSLRASIFAQEGLHATVDRLVAKLSALYQKDQTPWVIGYSGGKDSTAVVQLIWQTILELPNEKRTKDVYVITTDTLVENPVVAAWVNQSLTALGDAANAKDLPFRPHLIKPNVKDTFWVNLIGKGYPAPRPKFRWCTERLKIKPSSQFIQDVANRHGETILFLGARSAESTARAGSIAKHEKEAIEGLSPHPDLVNTLVMSPIKDWSNDDVWTFLMQIANPWGHSNKDLMAMYRGATEDNECPVVVDTSTPSCGNSRFGCWVCTLVDQDKSMGAMIQNDVEKEWMLPLLELRNELDFRGDEARTRERSRRDFRRLGGHLSHYKDKDGNYQLVPGPYLQEYRAHWLRRLLTIQSSMSENPNAPAYVRGISLISLEELQEIRRIWVEEKREIEDLLPNIYEEALNEPYPGTSIDENLVFDSTTFNALREICGDDRLLYETTRNLLDVERRYRTKGVRRGLFSNIEECIEDGFFTNADEALEWHKQQKDLEDPDDAEASAVEQKEIPLSLATDAQKTL